FFRFGIPLVFKRTDRLFSTEADALGFLNRVAPHLPIPKLIDTFQLDGASYAIITKIPGKTLIEQPDLDENVFATVKDEILGVIDELWRIPQPPNLSGKVMVSASGHGLPHPGVFYEHIGGSYESTLELYKTMSMALTTYPPDVLNPILEDRVVWQPVDLAMQNVLIQDGHLSGIIDWEDAGWLPRHWLLHRLRCPRPGCTGLWARYWILTHKFDPATEAAYSASLTQGLLMYSI
ncbi:hypothetical protein DICSQDRAFT_55036, partial [Dichomitus squalens LYAD-421 SS1]|uniref:uncharacterized protein n=1 Tax=Dichomitus squalens (strain LYAD-421) TaxID=732165 RepID=UPI000441084F